MMNSNDKYPQITVDFKNYSSIINTYLDGNCNKHKSKLEIFCPHPDCLASKQFLLCIACYREHELEHMPGILPYPLVFSPKLHHDLMDLIVDQDNRLAKAAKVNPEAFQKLDTLYEDLRKDITQILNNSKEMAKRNLVQRIMGSADENMGWIKCKAEIDEKLRNVMKNSFQKVQMNDLTDYLKKFTEVHEIVLKVGKSNEALTQKPVQYTGTSYTPPLVLKSRIAIDVKAVENMIKNFCEALKEMETNLLQKEDQGPQSLVGIDKTKTGIDYMSPSGFSGSDYKQDYKSPSGFQGSQRSYY